MSRKSHTSKPQDKKDSSSESDMLKRDERKRLHESETESNDNIRTAIAEILASLRRQEEESMKDRKKRDEQNRAVQENLTEIRNELKDVRDKYKEIENWCGLIETNFSELSRIVQEMPAKVEQLKEKVEWDSGKIQECSDTILKLQNKIKQMDESIDRLEGLSRRQNIRFFGIPSEEREDSETCTKCIVDTLNGVEGYKKWCEDDIDQAYRVGQARQEESKTMIVKFKRWQDKMYLFRNKQFRAKLKDKVNVRYANDLTKKQLEIANKAKEIGKIAIFVKGKLKLMDKSDNMQERSAEIASGTTTKNSNKEQKRQSSCFRATTEYTSLRRQGTGGQYSGAEERRRQTDTSRSWSHAHLAEAGVLVSPELSPSTVRKNKDFLNRENPKAPGQEKEDDDDRSVEFSRTTPRVKGRNNSGSNSKPSPGSSKRGSASVCESDMKGKQTVMKMYLKSNSNERSLRSKSNSK